MINLKKITFKNFKVFGGERYTIDFSGSHLTILGGPNGYGKTSVFDGIELALTGKLRRLVILENRQTPNDVVVAHNNATDVEIEIELDGSENLTLLRKLKSPVPREAKKVSKFEDLWDTFKLKDGNWTPISNKDVFGMLENPNFLRDFHLFHYIQQEESAHFLKGNNEVQRAEALSQLFGGTKNADENLASLNWFCKEIDIPIKTIESRIGELEKTIGNNDQFQTRDYEHLQNFSLLPWLSTDERRPIWDHENLKAVSFIQITEFTEEISRIEALVRHQDFFLRDRTFRKASQQRELLKTYLKYWNPLKNFDDIINQQEKASFLKGFAEKLRDISTLSKAKTEDIEKLFNFLGINNFENFTRELAVLTRVKSDSASSDMKYSDLAIQRSALEDHVRSITSMNECALCGHDYKSHEALLSAIDDHKKTLLAVQTDQSRRLILLTENFLTQHIQPLVSKVNQELENARIVEHEQLNELRTARTLHERLLRLDQWLTSENVEVSDLLEAALPHSRPESEFEKITEELSNRIRLAAGSPTELYTEEDQDKFFEDTYIYFFGANPSNLAQLDKKFIENKLAYVEYQYRRTVDSSFQELHNLREKRIRLLDLKVKATTVSKKVSSEIKQYRKKLITDIEIPFYIYSSKLLQAHQAGLGHGIFIKDPTGGDELKNVRLVANWASDHDILNTMSSGQISAVVIALTLALNRVYCKKFGPVLIDDPVQTMDDINMSSLVELLRNDFHDRQLVLSTHEEKASRYFHYKYTKFGAQTKRINLIDRKTEKSIN
jgi:exonuclease SbcC